MSEREAKALRLFVGARVSLATVRALDESVQVMRRAAERSRSPGSSDGATPERSRPSRGGPRWVAPASYHITLKFLGWARPEVAFAVRDRMAAVLAGQTAFEFETRGLGAFPSIERARVLWAGVDEAGAARLCELARRVERAAEELGFAREQRPFHPHVTLARLGTPCDVRTVLSSSPEQMFRSSWVDSVVLFESHMKSNGSEYEEKARWQLEADSKASRRHTGPIESETELADELALDEPSGDDFAPEGPADRAEDEEQHDNGD